MSLYDLVASLPDGPHSVVFGTEPATPVVVERILTRTIENVPTTSITVGATTRQDGYVANTWYVGLGPTAPARRALALYNNTTAASAVSISAVTPQGIQAVSGLTDIAVAPGAIRYIDLTNQLTRNNELVVSATTQVFVERVLPREADAQGRVAVWAVPANE